MWKIPNNLQEGEEKEVNNNDEDWLNSEFEIRIWKESGRQNTTQMYQGSKAEILTCVSSMIEQLLSNGIVKSDELLMAIKLPLERLKNKEEEK